MNTLPTGIPAAGGPAPLGTPGSSGAQGGKVEKGGFGEALGNALNEVTQLQNQADQAIEKLAAGEVQDIHQVMIQFEQARLSMQTLVEVRNKLVDAYQEISRMPI